jgi:hypothetical protein
MLSNVTVVAETGLGWMRSCLIAWGTVIAYVEAEGIDASDARVAGSDIKRRRDRAMRHFRLTVWDASSSRLSQVFLLTGATIVSPVILACSAFAYSVFRGKAPEKGWEG